MKGFVVEVVELKGENTSLSSIDIRSKNNLISVGVGKDRIMVEITLHGFHNLWDESIELAGEDFHASGGDKIVGKSCEKVLRFVIALRAKSMERNSSFIIINSNTTKVADLLFCHQHRVLQLVYRTDVQVHPHVILFREINHLSIEGRFGYPSISSIAGNIGELLSDIAVSGDEEDILVRDEVPGWRFA